MATWTPGTRVEWTPGPNGGRQDYGVPVRGTVADAPVMEELDGMIGCHEMADGVRIPVDLDPPIPLAADKTSRPITIDRLYVRERFLREVAP